MEENLEKFLVVCLFFVLFLSFFFVSVFFFYYNFINSCRVHPLCFRSGFNGLLSLSVGMLLVRDSLTHEFCNKISAHLLLGVLTANPNDYFLVCAVLLDQHTGFL